MAHLVLFLNHSIDRAVLMDDAGQATYVDPNNLSEFTSTKVIVVVPTQDVLLLTATLPKLSKSKLMQALPYALEEKLISDVDSLHFAMGPQTTTGLSVAVVAHVKMQQWLQQLKEQQIQPAVMIPDVLLLPVIANEWQVFISAVAQVRIDANTGFTVEKENLFLYLNSTLEQAEQLPEKICLHFYAPADSHQKINNTLIPAFSGITDFALDKNIVINETIHSEEQLFLDLARSANQQCCRPHEQGRRPRESGDLVAGINLLQGKYTVKPSRFSYTNKLWRSMPYLAVTWMMLMLLYPCVSFFMLKHKINQINQQIEVVYKQAFPQATQIIAPKLRMQEKLHQLTSQAGKNRLFLLLGQVGKDLITNPTVQLKRLSFQNNTLSLEINAASSEDFSTFTNYLTQQGLNVKQQNANLAGAHISAILEVS